MKQNSQRLSTAASICKVFCKPSAHLLKDHTTHFACLSLIYSIFIHVRLLTIISQSILLEQ
ncbi:hypothetical protein LDENG_00105180 [Lucifuga dentata]|nr:hypothetical protein LDENG_00105180 [Lucifuga dentata]